MIDLLLRLPNFITPANAVAAEAGEGLAGSGTIGFIVLAIIVGPVILLIIAAIFDSPRTFRIPSLFIGSIILLLGALISGFAIISALLGFIVPQ